MNKQVLSIPLDLIDVPPRLRELDPDWAALIAESFKERGQDTPIRVTEGDVATGRHRLIAGLHRLEAARLAGWSAIEAVVFSGDDIRTELLEIDENLIRRELSELDRATFLARRKELWEALYPQTKHGGTRRGDQVAKNDDLVGTALAQRFSADVAAKLGLSERTIQRAVKRHEALAEDVRKRLANTCFANRGTDLDLLATFTPEQQRDILDELLAEDGARARSVREAAMSLGLINVPRTDPVAEQLTALLTAWRKADRKSVV